jgi:hypothetical protein
MFLAVRSTSCDLCGTEKDGCGPMVAMVILRRLVWLSTREEPSAFLGELGQSDWLSDLHLVSHVIGRTSACGGAAGSRAFELLGIPDLEIEGGERRRIEREEHTLCCCDAKMPNSPVCNLEPVCTGGGSRQLRSTRPSRLRAARDRRGRSAAKNNLFEACQHFGSDRVPTVHGHIHPFGSEQRLAPTHLHSIFSGVGA